MNTVDRMDIKLKVKISMWEDMEKVLTQCLNDERERLSILQSDSMKELTRSSIRAYESKLKTVYDVLTDLKDIREALLFGEE